MSHQVESKYILRFDPFWVIKRRKFTIVMVSVQFWSFWLVKRNSTIYQSLETNLCVNKYKTLYFRVIWRSKRGQIEIFFEQLDSLLSFTLEQTRFYIFISRKIEKNHQKSLLNRIFQKITMSHDVTELTKFDRTHHFLELYYQSVSNKICYLV